MRGIEFVVNSKGQIIEWVDWPKYHPFFQSIVSRSSESYNKRDRLYDRRTTESNLRQDIASAPFRVTHRKGAFSFASSVDSRHCTYYNEEELRAWIKQCRGNLSLPSSGPEFDAWAKKNGFLLIEGENEKAYCLGGRDTEKSHWTHHFSDNSIVVLKDTNPLPPKEE